jgi:hypothetical protein
MAVVGGPGTKLYFFCEGPRRKLAEGWWEDLKGIAVS